MDLTDVLSALAGAGAACGLVGLAVLLIKTQSRVWVWIRWTLNI